MHSNLLRRDSAIIYANKIVRLSMQGNVGRGMIDPYGVLAINYYKYSEVDSASKYMELTLKSIKVSKIEEVEAVKFMRGYWLANIIALKASNDNGAKFKK